MKLTEKTNKDEGMLNTDMTDNQKKPVQKLLQKDKNITS